MVREFSKLPGKHTTQTDKLYDELMAASSEAEMRSAELYAEEEPDYEDERGTIGSGFNITALFSDL